MGFSKTSIDGVSDDGWDDWQNILCILLRMRREKVVGFRPISCSIPVFLSLCVLHTVQAQEKTLREEIVEGLKSSFSTPWHELLVKEHESEWRNLLDGFTVSTSLGYPLSRSPVRSGEGLDSQGSRAARNKTFNLGVSYNPLSYWFASINFTRYFDENLKAPWNPDFTYTFGYNDWHPWTLSLVYANYGGNRLNPDRSEGERHTHFDQGSWTLGWKTPPSESIQRLFRVHPESSLGCNAGLSFTPTFLDLASLSEKSWKKVVRFGCKYTIVGNWYINVTTAWYPDKSQKQPWDPDFTFTTRLKDGSVSLSWKWSF